MALPTLDVMPEPMEQVANLQAVAEPVPLPWPGTKWEYHQEVIPTNPETIFHTCMAAGDDGWELVAILPVQVKKPVIVDGVATQQGVMLMLKRPVIEGARPAPEVRPAPDAQPPA